MSRRRTWRVGAALGAVLLAVVGCTSTPPPPPPPTSVPPSPTASSTPDQIVIGVDSIAGGYNPHQLADMSTTTTALAQLLLPSVYRLGPDGKYQLDKTLMRSVEVVDEDPFTVAYTLRQDASWSDGAPIAAEDFRYLADQMRTQPGTVGPAGYRLITDVQSREGGKRVEVTFAKRFPGWRSLFANLLPSHLLKDIPGGWQEAMISSYPASGGPYAIKTIDVGRGEILIERNERYWEKPSAVDQLILRAVDSEGPAEELRNNNLQFSLTATDAGRMADLRALGKAVELHTVHRPQVAEIALRPVREPLADEQVREAIAALIDRDELIRIGTGGGPAEKLRADAQVLAPSQRAYRATLPADRGKPDPQRAESLLRQAGYRLTPDGWADADGEPLSLVVASPGEQEPYASIAERLAEQLTEAGVEAKAVQPDPRELYAVDPADPDAEPIDDGSGNEVFVDVLVGPRAVSLEPATDFASRFSCRKADTSDDTDADFEPGNVAGWCDQYLQSRVDDVLTGERSLRSELGSLEPRLWRENVTIPLFQLADTLAVGRDVSGVTQGPPLAGPFGSAVNWLRITE